MGIRRVNKPGAGRPRVYATDLPVYDSMEQCSAATGIPKEAIAHAKANGCLCVRHNRVHLSEFLRWFFSQDAGDTIDWKGRHDRAKALREEIKLEVDRHHYVDFALADRFIGKLVSEVFFGEIERLKVEFPANMPGKSALDVRVEVDKKMMAISNALRCTMEAWKAEAKRDVKSD